MNICLYGIRGTYNFGCEAIVRGSVVFIKNVFPDAHVIYLSYSYEYDKVSLADLDIEIVPIIENNHLIKRAINKALDILNVEERWFSFDYKKIFENIDLIFSIGGDIYTIPQVLRQKKRYKYYNQLVDLCERSGKPVIVYGASVGPWGQYAKAVDYYRKNLLKYKNILCREKNTVKYLKDLGLEKTLFSPDPAFLLGEQKNYSGDKIGINFSPLSFKEVYGDYNDNRIRLLANLVDRIQKETGKDIVFLPHVLSKEEYDNDLVFLKKVKMKMSCAEKVEIANSESGFRGIKESIRDCALVISARMHCAINALEENIPAILLSYSSKSIGMCEYIYGNRKWALSLEDIEKHLVSMVVEMYDKRKELSIFLNEQNSRIMNDYAKSVEQFKELF